MLAVQALQMAKISLTWAVDGDGGAALGSKVPKFTSMFSDREVASCDRGINPIIACNLPIYLEVEDTLYNVLVPKQ